MDGRASQLCRAVQSVTGAPEHSLKDSHPESPASAVAARAFLRQWRVLLCTGFLEFALWRPFCGLVCSLRLKRLPVMVACYEPLPPGFQMFGSFPHTIADRLTVSPALVTVIERFLFVLSHIGGPPAGQRTRAALPASAERRILDVFNIRNHSESVQFRFKAALRVIESHLQALPGESGRIGAKTNKCDYCRQVPRHPNIRVWSAGIAGFLWTLSRTHRFASRSA